jgi:MFS family permease
VVAVGHATSVVSLTLLLILLGIASGAGSTAPTAILADVTPRDKSGTGVGAFRFFGDLGFVLGPAVAGWSANAFGFRAAFALAAVPLLVALALAARTPETHRLHAAVEGPSA